jgi:radial spoke head protein 4A
MYSYFVTHDVLEDWFELPLITPEQVVEARNIKYIFSGDLNKEVVSYPPFPGKEKHLLKAQIVRISSASVLCPRGLYKVNDDNQRIVEFEEEVFKLAEYSEMKSLDYWVFN